MSHVVRVVSLDSFPLVVKDIHVAQLLFLGYNFYFISIDVYYFINYFKGYYCCKGYYFI